METSSTVLYHVRSLVCYPVQGRCSVRPTSRVQAMLRHADSGTTLDLYTHAINRDKLVAQNQVMEAMMKSEVVN